MNNRPTFLKLALVTAFIAAGVFALNTARAQDTTATTAATSTTVATPITFPIAALGNCGSTKECRTYCDQLVNIVACVNFAKENGLIKPTDADNALKLATVKTGPAGCTGRDACATFCADPANADACAKFAADHNLLSKTDIQKFKNFQSAVKKRNAPSGCHDQHTCETFCEQMSHNAECLKFSLDNGLIDKTESEDISKFQAAVAAGTTPGGCATKDACKTYCADPTHTTECVAFAQQLGLVKPDEAQKILKDGFTGPGGCNSKDACATFCNDPANQQTCLDFATQHEVLSKDDANEIVNTQQKIKSTAKHITQDAIECMKRVLGSSAVGQIQSGQFTPDSTSAAPIQACLDKAAQDGRRLPMGSQFQGSDSNQSGFMLPPAIRDCILKNYSQDLLDQIEKSATTVGLRDKIPLCLISPTAQPPVSPEPTVPLNSTSGSSD